MKRQIRSFAVLAAFLAPAVCNVASAASPALELVPIAAEEAFDAVAMQIDPASGMKAAVYLIDVRDPYEVYMNGGPAAIEEIDFLGDDKGVMPDYGKVRLIEEGKFLEYRANGRYRRKQVREVESMGAMPLATNIPLWRLVMRLDDDGNWSVTFDKADANGFRAAVADQEYPRGAALILFCRTGGRSSQAGSALLELAEESGWTLYEIDDPNGTPNHGGFSGPDYDAVFAGYDGFPSRFTDRTRVPSASWVDAGLPVIRKSEAIVLP